MRGRSPFASSVSITALIFFANNGHSSVRRSVFRFFLFASFIAEVRVRGRRTRKFSLVIKRANVILLLSASQLFFLRLFPMTTGAPDIPDITKTEYQAGLDQHRLILG